jgi:ketosteroid isomerase-like protein
MPRFCTVPPVLQSLRRAVEGAVPVARGTLRRVADARRERSAGPAQQGSASSPLDVVGRLEDALKRHDLDALVDCFHHEYRGEQPLHPREPAVDREQLRRNWETFFADVSDVRTEVLDTAVSCDTVWSEWRIYGTRRDGSPLDLRSVWIFGILDEKVAWGRLYREPIDVDDLPDTVERLTRPE